jgi:galactose-1-phosphate uridylyltransferase
MSEFRKDIVSGDWIIMAPERAKRPDDFLGKKVVREVAPKRTCPFEEGVAEIVATAMR